MKTDVGKSILVTGDFVIDHHIYEGLRFHFRDNVRGVHGVKQWGGAGLVAGILEKLPIIGAEVVCESAMPSDSDHEKYDAHRAYALWRRFPRSGSTEKQYWRCKDVMGFGRLELNPDSVKKDTVAEDKSTSLASLSNLWKRDLNVPTQPKYIVISEGGMGFRNRASCWESLPFDRASQIILKTSAPFHGNKLLDSLSADFREKLVCVVSVDELRKSSARISTGLSWEATFADIIREIGEGGRLHHLSRCRHLVVTCSSEGAVWFDLVSAKNKLGISANESRVCFIYNAGSIEMDHAYRTDGTAFGFLSCMAAAVTWAFATPQPSDAFPQPLSGDIEAGLAAMHDLREKGHGAATEEPRGFPFERVAQVIKEPGICLTRVSMTFAEATKTFTTADASLLTFTRKGAAQKPSERAQLFARLAAENGPIALDNLPHLRIGKFLTADRVEIESLRAVAQTLRRYAVHDDGKKPLSLGVFGPPGAGKSFVVRELSKTIFGDRAAWLEFNLSQFASSDDLNGALHQVRDRVLQGKLPVAFFDEFDARDYYWLQYLLAPMQDGRFQQGMLTHTLGKAVFIFAGGTSWTFDSFGPPAMGKTDDAVKRFNEFRRAKGPDFKSRLDAFLNVVGPNRRSKPADRTEEKVAVDVSGHLLAEDTDDIWFPIRRSLIMRAELGLAHEQRLRIDPGLLNAILRVSRYTHGARSLTKILSPLKMALPGQLQPSYLPPDGQVAMHADLREFRDLLASLSGACEFQADKLQQEFVNAIAPKIHDAYTQLGLRAGWQEPGTEKTLEEFAREEGNEIKALSNYGAAERIPRVLALVGLCLNKGHASSEEEQSVRQHIEYHLELLANAEHEGWMAWYRKMGYSYHPVRNDKKKRHDCLKPFSELKEADKAKDREQVRRYPDFVRAVNHNIVFAK
ncbi:MAG: AAA family ATPase [Candidatus Hydrogenedentes bacterium]|nr:AAA family ATPase [Candidatus Hydrogenedentota bacterium]